MLAPWLCDWLCVSVLRGKAALSVALLHEDVWGTASEGEGAYPASFLLFWRKFCQKLPEGPAVRAGAGAPKGGDVPACCLWLAVLPDSCPTGLEPGGLPCHTAPHPAPDQCRETQGSPDRCWQGRDVRGHSKRCAACQIIEILSVLRGKRCSFFTGTPV